MHNEFRGVKSCFFRMLFFIGVPKNAQRFWGVYRGPREAVRLLGVLIFCMIYTNHKIFIVSLYKIHIVHKLFIDIFTILCII